MKLLTELWQGGELGEIILHMPLDTKKHEGRKKDRSEDPQ